MKKLVPILIAGALVLAACSGGSASAATVDGETITTDYVESLMADSADVVEKAVFARYLGAAIQLEILFTAAEEDYGIVPDDEAVAAEAERIYTENNQDQTREEFLDAAGISEALFLDIARQGLIQEAVSEELGADAEPSEEEIAEAMKLAEWDSAEVCAAHILVDTEDEANDLLSRLDDGEEFADLAMELSTDTGSGAAGGDLGCSPPSRYVREFAEASMTAEIGVPTDPVMSQFGYHVILVTDRTEADPADLPSEAEIVAELTDSLGLESFNTWYIEAVAAADVQVEEEYGTWSPGPPPSVTPPAA